MKELGGKRHAGTNEGRRVFSELRAVLPAGEKAEKKLGE
jgi:hypothetical protein